MKTIRDLAVAIEEERIPAVTVELAYRVLNELFKTKLPDGPIMKNGVHVLDRKYLFFYMIMEFTVSEVVHAFSVVMKRTA